MPTKEGICFRPCLRTLWLLKGPKMNNYFLIGTSPQVYELGPECPFLFTKIKTTWFKLCTFLTVRLPVLHVEKAVSKGLAAGRTHKAGGVPRLPQSVHHLLQHAVTQLTLDIKLKHHESNSVSFLKSAASFRDVNGEGLQFSRWVVFWNRIEQGLQETLMQVQGAGFSSGYELHSLQ